MRLTLERSGGFAAAVPALSRDIVVDTAVLPEASSSELHRLVADVADDARSQTQEVPPGAADVITFRLSVDDGEQQWALEFTDPVTGRALAALVARLQDIDLRPPPA